MTVSTVDAAVAAKEMRRWVSWLGGSMIASAIFIGAALAGLGGWLLLPAIIVGPGVGGVALVWLAITTDTNGVVRTTPSDSVLPSLAVAEPEV